MWTDLYDSPVQTVGVSGEEEVQCVLEDAEELGKVFAEFQPTKVVCTIGINEARGEGDFEYWMMDHLRINCYLPMHVLMTWIEQASEGKVGGPPAGAHFVAISSNSAHIPRSQSMAYNASKAALSMALRSAARDIGKAEWPMSVYGYEPGLIKGTPMSGERGGTRMLGPGLGQGLSRRTLAGQIVHNLAFGGAELNGVLMRIDAGEV
jgi:NAD(P)-dependent dehydrogenase (short-subunit alcohol dehydrogenase family)